MVALDFWVCLHRCLKMVASQISGFWLRVWYFILVLIIRYCRSEEPMRCCSLLSYVRHYHYIPSFSRFDLGLGRHLVCIISVCLCCWVLQSIWPPGLADSVPWLRRLIFALSMERLAAAICIFECHFLFFQGCHRHHLLAACDQELSPCDPVIFAFG